MPRAEKSLKEVIGEVLHSLPTGQERFWTNHAMSSAPTTLKLRPFRHVAFGEYTLLRQIALGGMGEVFLARHEQAALRSLCVMKKILPEFASEPAFVRRFLSECEVLQTLNHPNIAKVVKAGAVDGTPFLAMEFVDGRDLRRVLDRLKDSGRPLPVGFVVHVAQGVLAAMQSAYTQLDEQGEPLRLVHRDLNPSNILVGFDGQVKVIDFGLAKSTISAHQTLPTFRLGKLLYMSPEQALGQRLDARSDIYSLGLTLYELLALRQAFEEVPRGALARAVVSPQISGAALQRQHVPQSLCDIVMKALAPDAEERFQSAADMLAALTALDEVAGGRPTAAVVMRETFGVEYEQERKVLAGLLAGTASLVAEAASLPRSSVSPVPAPTPLFAWDEVTASVPRPELSAEALTESAVPVVDLGSSDGQFDPPVVGERRMAQGHTRREVSNTRRIGWAWLVLPLLAVVAGATYWRIDHHFEQQRKLQLQKEQREAEALDAQEKAEDESRSRELKGAQAKAAAEAEAAETLAALTSKKRGKGGRTVVTSKPVSPAGTPLQLAFRALQTDFERLNGVNETVVKNKYRLRMLRLKSRVEQGDETATTVAEIKALHAELKDELLKPENR